MRRTIVLLSAGLIALAAGSASAQEANPRNLILFVPDGLRGRIVTPQTAPAMAEVRDKGVNFKNSHSLFPTFTMANGSAMASGHYLGDTGTFSNTIYTGRPIAHSNNTVTPFLEVNPVLLEVDEHFGGDYMNEETLLKMAREKGYSTAAIGKHGPTFIFDHTDKVGTAGLHSIIIDDATGGKNGVALSDEMKEALTNANLPLVTPSRATSSRATSTRTTSACRCRRHRGQARGAHAKGQGQAVRRRPGCAIPTAQRRKHMPATVKSTPAANGRRTVLNFQRVGTQRYFDTAGFPGRTLGLEAERSGRRKQKTARK